MSGYEETFTGNAENWNSKLQNLDESVYNNSSEYVRLYYGPDYGNPHTCISPGESYSFDNLESPFLFYFNSNGPAFQVWDDVHGSTMGSGACSGDMLTELDG
jgi:Peptidase inhibitor family I36